MTFPRGSQAADGVNQCAALNETILPNSTVQTGDWVATVHTRIDEIGNDADFTTSDPFTTSCDSPVTGTPFIVTFQDPAGTPADSACQSIRVTFRARIEETTGSGTIDIFPELMQGASTVIASGEALDIGTTFTSFTFETTISEYNNITDHDELEIRFTAEGCVTSGGDEVECEVSGVTVEYITR